MNARKICLWWFDTNWVKKGAAEHYIVIIDYEKGAYASYFSYNQPSGVNAIEVKRKSDLTDYVNALGRLGFRETKSQSELGE